MISPRFLHGLDRKMMTRRSAVVLAVATISLLLLYTSRMGAWSVLDHDPHKSHHAPQGSPDGARVSPPPLPPGPPPPSDPACEGFPDTSKVLVVLKTGASEAFARVPMQMMTMLRCLPDYLLFSDMEQDIGGQHIHDSLDTVLAEAQEGNADFDLYRRQQWCLVDQESCNKLGGDPAREGWNLDKYKTLHVAEKAYRMRPGRDWYLFVEADTYVLWPNMMQWLKQLDPTKKLYLGSAAMVHNFNFAHGGSGYLVSRAAMEAFVGGEHRGVANEYDVQVKDVCCGDYMFARAIKDKTDVGVQNVWPTINGEKPSTLPFGPSHWCHPIVTMHHMNAEEINTFYHFEQRRQRKLILANQSPSTPLLLREIYDEFLAPHLNETRADWDNLADNRFYLDTESGGGHVWENWQLARMKKPEEYSALEKVAHRSFEDCAAACRSLPGEECFRYKYVDGACSISNAFIMGRPVKREAEERKRTMSGWEVEKIKKWVKKQGSCRKVRWPEVRVEG